MFNSEGSKEFQPYEQQSFMQHHGRQMMNHAAAANYTTLNNVRTSINVENELQLTIKISLKLKTNNLFQGYLVIHILLL